MKARVERRFKLWPEALSLRSMRGRMAVLLGLAMLPAGAIAMQVGLNAAEARQSAYEAALGRRALQSISTERGAIDEVREMLRVMAAAPAMAQIEARDCGEWLGGVISQYPYVATIAVSNNAGEILCSIPETPDVRRRADSPLRRTASARDAFTIGYVARDEILERPVLSALEPMRQSGRRTGFVGASITVEELQRLLDRGRALDGARAALVDSSGLIIAQSAPPDGEPPGLPSVEQIRDQLGADPSFIDVDGGSAVVVPLHAPDIYEVMSWAPDRPAWQRWGAIAFSIAAPLLIWLLAIGAGWFAIEVFVAQPLSSLEAAARGYARGEDVVDSVALRNAPSEIRSLRRTLAAMAKTLRGRELRLVEALDEERALLREVHHRVKNNLQMVASLLNIQARAARDDSEAWGLARAHDRVQLLALVHQRIYASGELRDLRLDDLTAEIARQLLQSRGAQAKDIVLTLNLQPARVSADRAVPLAFMIGEGVSVKLDSLTGVGPVELRVWLTQDGSGEIRFAIDALADLARVTAAGPNARLIDAFARQVGATLGRDPARPYRLWAVVPPTEPS